MALAALSAIIILYLSNAFFTDHMSSRLTFAVINTTVSTLCLALSYFMAKRNLKYAEFHGPILFGSFDAITFILNAT